MPLLKQTEQGSAEGLSYMVMLGDMHKLSTDCILNT